MTSLRREARFGRLIVALTCAALLSGCSSDSGGDWLYLWRAAKVTWNSRDAPVGLNDAAAIPYATLGLSIDGNREQILVLAMDAGGGRLWASSAHLAITTRDGRVVRTAGFAGDLSGFAANESGREDWTRPHTYSWTADYESLGAFSVAVNCDVRPMGADPITILGQSFDTFRVDEACRADRLDWSFTNSYWISVSSGRVWRSINHFTPKGPELEMELLRPPLTPN